MFVTIISMKNQEKSSKFGLGMIVGLISGALAGLFLAPKSGRRLRANVLKKARQIRKQLEDTNVDEVINEIFENVSEQSRTLFFQIKDTISVQLAELQESVENIDKEKYLRVVRSVLDQFREKKELTEDQIERVKRHLEEDFVKLNQKLVKKSVSKKSKKASARKS